MDRENSTWAFTRRFSCPRCRENPQFAHWLSVKTYKVTEQAIQLNDDDELGAGNRWRLRTIVIGNSVMLERYHLRNNQKPML